MTQVLHLFQTAASLMSRVLCRLSGSAPVTSGTWSMTTFGNRLGPVVASICRFEIRKMMRNLRSSPSRSANPSFSASVVCIGQRALGVADRGRWAVFESRRPPPHQSPNPRQRYTHFSLQAFRSFSGAADASAR